MRAPDASLLYNLSDGVFGVVPAGSGKDFARAPIGSGAFRFVSDETDKEVVLARNPTYWGGADQAGPARLEGVRFVVVPDAVTVALELRKGTLDVASNELTLDLVHALAGRPNLVTAAAESSRVLYLNFNCMRGPLRDPRVRRAVALAIDRQAVVDAAYRGQATLANTLLPAEHWAAAALPGYPHDPAQARALLDSAGWHAGKDGVRLHLEMKTSQDATTRLLAEIMQQQLADAGIALTLRATEFGTFYSDVTAGRFELYALTWVGSNEDPDIFRYAYGSDRVPPRGGNRGRFSDPHIDQLLAQAAAITDEPTRRQTFVEVQRVLEEQEPTVPLWYPRNEIVHTARLAGVQVPADGSFDFLRRAWLR